MVFSSPTFLFLFLPLVLAGYFVLPRALRGGFLLVASLFFYAFGEQEILSVLIAASAVGFFGGSWTAKADSERKRRFRLGCTTAAVLSFLLIFKYATWGWGQTLVFAERSGLGGEAWPRGPRLELPIGISFFTFQILSYVFDVARGNVAVQNSFRRFLLYVALFPQLVAGPIVRYKDIERDLDERRLVWDDVAAGMRRFCVGLIKKVLVADNLAFVADRVFSLEAGELTRGAAWLGITAYTVQIYFDFSGYSDMAIGLGRVFGFRFPENFRHPYAARSITEFWRRWHISLSSWFRDYVYIPLGGNRHGALRTSVNLWVVFLLCGAWHGAAWNFVLWGAYHGAWLVAERSLGVTAEPRGLRAFFGWLRTLLAVMVGWVLFRAVDLEHALQILQRLVFERGDQPGGYPAALFLDPRILPAVLLALLTVLPLSRLLRARLEARAAWSGPWLDLGRSAVLAVLFAGAVLEVAGSSYSPFIYFRF